MGRKVTHLQTLVLQDENKVPSFLPFTVVFAFLKKKKWKNANNDELEQLQGPSKHALFCLNKFYKTKGEFNLSI